VLEGVHCLLDQLVDLRLPYLLELSQEVLLPLVEL
jgi:hypothetical protein